MTNAQRTGLGAVLTLQLVLGLLLATWLPPWLGHEADYFNNVRFLVENGRLPARGDFVGADRGPDITQATQGPLFFYVAAPLVALLDDNAPVPPGVHPTLVCDGTVARLAYTNVLTRSYNNPVSGAPAAGLSIRILNLFFGLGTTATVYFIARRLPSSTHALALVAASFVAFMPQILSLNVFISGEGLLLFISGLNLYFALRLIQGSNVRMMDVAILVATAALGPLTKTNGYVLVVGTCVTLAYLLIRSVMRAPRSRNTRTIGIGAALMALALMAVSIFNLLQYGSVIGRYQDILTVAISGLGEIRIEALAYTLRDTLLDYTSAFPVQREKVLWLYVVGGLSGLVAFSWVAVSQFFKRDWRALRPNLLLSVYALAALGLVLIRGNLTNELAPDKAYAPMRYYISGFPAVAVMSAIGWDAISRVVFRNRFMLRLANSVPWYGRFSTANPLGFAWVTVWFSIAVLSVYQLAQFGPQTYLQSEARFDAVTQYERDPVLMESASLDADVPYLHALRYSVQDDGMLQLTTLMSVEDTSARNQVAVVTVSDAQGRTTTCEVVPQDGLFPVTRWEPGQTVVVPMEIPNCITPSDDPMRAPLDVSIGWREADLNGEFVGVSRMESRAVLDVDLPRFSGCVASLGVIGGDLQVVQFNGPNTIVAGETFLPSVNWYVRDSTVHTDLSRIYVLKHHDTSQTFTCQGVPRLGDYPIDLWRRGEIVYFDQCAFSIPEDAPSGAYTLSIGLMENATGILLPVEPIDGALTAEGLLGIAELTIDPTS